ncbi:M14 metallopeptidase family protein [Alteromonas facilis]|uniref:M14 metallopeptidase family protein n=1 Tax=Alteromonas facilis TaxID=2048004 RepID=UPI000C28E41F|nr:M14 metallopeptidase family protein [Alteromonas facilis]
MSKLLINQQYCNAFIRRSLGLFSIVMSIVLAGAAYAGKPAHDYLPKGINFDPSIPLPSSVLGAEVGEWHVRHDQLVAYMHALAKASDRVSIQETGRTHENRPLLLLTISAPENQVRIGDIQKTHVQTLLAGEKPSADAPLVLYMGYSVHGNEPSGANASMLIAYYLAAAQSEEVQALLQSNVVLLDPSLNPDGLSRFAQWANMHRGKALNADRDHREHQEGWPSGRTNHYWFDLNRDWLLLTHPESRARIAQYHAWRPHILTDFHEMGPDSTYFFQPGIPSRKNPMTPQSNVTLTEALAEFHAAALDENKVLYFTEEGFDDFYYGKGSTYPDAHGSIGILFEQASSRGHLQETINGELAFEQTIQNQVTTTLSTFAGAMANKQAILQYQQQFHADTQALAKQDKKSGYLIENNNDSKRMQVLTDLLARHQISFAYLSESYSIEGATYPAGSVFVPTEQAQYRLLTSMFSTQTSFADNTFYDVSSWNLPYAFDLDFTAVDSGQRRRLKLTDSPQVAPVKAVSPDAYAYAIEWHHYNAPAILSSLLQNGVSVRVAGDGFTALTDGEQKAFAAGTIVIPQALKQPDELIQLLEQVVETYSVPVFAIRSGLTPNGIDLGSRQLIPVDTPSIAIVGGRGTSQYEVGEIWHYIDTRMQMPASIIELWRMGQVDLSQYSHIVLANGNYNDMPSKAVEAIARWVKSGGILIGQKGGMEFLIEQNWLNADMMPATEVDKLFSTKNLRYGDRDALSAKKLIAGTVFLTDADLTHPLAFGLDDAMLPMFKTNNAVIKAANAPFTVPFSYTEQPLASGYADTKLAELIAQTPAAVAHRVGQGRVIGFADNLNFRGYWYGTSKVFANAIYMAELINAR